MPRPREEPHCVVVPLKSVNHHSQPHLMPCMKWRILCLPVGRGQCAAGTRLLLTHLSFSRALIKAFVSLKSLKIVQPFNRMLSEMMWFPTAKKDPSTASCAAVCKVSFMAFVEGVVPWELAMLSPQAHTRAEQAGPSYFIQSNSTCMCCVCAHVCIYMHVYLSVQLGFVEKDTVLGPEQHLWICERERHAHFPQGLTVKGDKW